MVCEHCQAKKSNLHRFTEPHGIAGTMEVIRCVLCGWRTQQLKPRPPLKKRWAIEEDDCPENEVERFLNFAAEPTFNAQPIASPTFFGFVECGEF